MSTHLCIGLLLLLWILTIQQCQCTTCSEGETFIIGKCFAAIIEARSLSLEFGWSVNTRDPPTPATTQDIATELKERFVVWSRNLTASTLKPFCADDACSNLEIEAVVNDFDDVDVRMKIEPVEKQFNARETNHVVYEAFYYRQFEIKRVPTEGGNAVYYSYFMNVSYYCEAGWEAINQALEQCGQCTLGSYWSAVTEKCAICSEGQYQDTPGQSYCKDCPTGLTTYVTGSRSSQQCQESCSTGYYFKEESASCEACPYGEYMPYLNSMTCYRCPSGLTTPYRAANSSHACYAPCRTSGYELQADGRCVPCPWGSYLDLAQSPHCQACREGLNTSVAGASSSDQCNVVVCGPGQFRLLDSEDAVLGRCRDCPIGTYKTASMPGDATDCASCGDPSKWRTDEPGADRQELCKFFCPAGSFVHDEYACRPCPHDTYKARDDYYASFCTPCPEDRPKTQGIGGTSLSACKYARCSTGEEIVLESPTRCQACDYGYYQPVPEPISERCQQCPQGTTTKLTGAPTIEQCDRYCESGYELIDGECSQCKQGAYKDNSLTRLAKFEPCTLCDNGFTTPGEGAASEDSCSVSNCTEGSWLSVDEKKCYPCMRGSYQDEWWQTSCKPCPDPESTTLITGATLPADCNVFPNRTRVAMQLNFDLPWNDALWDHNSRQYTTLETRILTHMDVLLRSVSAFRGSLVMKTLSPGSVYAHLVAKFNKNSPSVLNEITSIIDYYIDTYKTITEGQVDGVEPLPVDVRASNLRSVVVIGDGKYDTCLYGEYLDYVAGQCKACPVGSYQSRDMVDVCRPCLPGHTTDQEGTSGSEEDSCLLICPAGQSRVDDVCQPCPIGSYKEGEGTSLCSLCQQGFSTKASGASKQSDCRVVCQEGEFSASGTECESCPLNTYSNQPYQSSCTPCPTQHITTATGATTEEQCKNPCEQDVEVCFNGGICQWSSVGEITLCSCTEEWKGDRCQTQDTSAEDLNTWVYIGAGAGGGLIILILIILLVVCATRRKKSKSASSSSASAQGQDNPVFERRGSSCTDTPSQQFVTPVLMASTSSIFQTGVIASSTTPWASSSSLQSPPPPYEQSDTTQAPPKEEPEPPIERINPLRSSLKIFGQEEQTKTKKKPAKKVKFAKKNQTKSINLQELPKTPVSKLPPSASEVESPYDQIPAQSVTPVPRGQRSEQIPEPRSPEPRSPEPRSLDPRSQEPRSPEPRSLEPRSPEARVQGSAGVTITGPISSRVDGYLLPLRRDVLEQMVMPRVDNIQYQTLNTATSIPMSSMNSTNGVVSSNMFGNTHVTSTIPSYNSHMSGNAQVTGTTNNMAGSMPQLVRSPGQQQAPPAYHRHSSPPTGAPEGFAVVQVGRY